MEKTLQIILTVTISIVAVLVVFLISNSVTAILDEKKRKKKLGSLVNGVTLEEQMQFISKMKPKVKKPKKYPFKGFIDEYAYFDGNFKKMIITLISGYILFFLLYFIITKNVVISLSFAFYFILIYYLKVSSGLQKKRIKFLRSFSSALEIYSASLEAGNSTSTAIEQITQRKNLHPKVIREFDLLHNDLADGTSLEQALNEFWKRNNMFNEVTMFVIVVQFYEKTGGRNTKQMFGDMKKSINTTIESYSQIDSRTSIYSMMLLIFTIISVAFTLVGGFFIDGFYTSLTGSFIGYVKMYGSMLLLIFANYFQRSMVKNAAEA